MHFHGAEVQRGLFLGAAGIRTLLPVQSMMDTYERVRGKLPFTGSALFAPHVEDGVIPPSDFRQGYRGPHNLWLGLGAY